MSMKYAELKKEFPNAKKETILKRMAPVYERPGRTKQSFKDSCDVNKILDKFAKTGSISHLEKHGSTYADFSEMPTDLLEARELIERGKNVFMELPAQVRSEFANDPIRFFDFVNDPANKDKLEELLPEIAKPGRYFPDMSPSTPPGALLGDASEPVASGNESGGSPPSPTETEPATGS